MAASMSQHCRRCLGTFSAIPGLFRTVVPGTTQVSRCYASLDNQNTEVEDELYRRLEVEVKGHDPEVLKSYETYVTRAAKELGINMPNVWTPPKHHNRRTLLKSVHVYKKHRVQYEMRTHFKCFEIKHITGSTASTFLEYIQRNLPEGVAMKVTKHQIKAIPDHIKPPEPKALAS